MEFLNNNYLEKQKGKTIMKKLLTIILFLIFLQVSYSHKQPVHQYIVREAYSLLKNQIGDIPDMSSHISTIEGNGGGIFATGLITGGTWNEDEFDVVYGYSKTNSPEIQGGGIYDLIAYFGGVSPDPFVSCTHFWDADNGDILDSDIEGTYDGQYFKFTIPNAYQKLLKYLQGGFQITWSPNGLPVRLFTTYGHRINFTNSIGQEYSFRFTYNELIQLYKTKTVTCKIRDFVLDETQNAWTTAYNLPILLSDAQCNLIVWEILGRMCHLLGDMSVPAHAHRDEHGTSPDSYEDWVAGNGAPYTYWNAQNSGLIINPYVSSNPLHYLMYTMQQISDHFGSNGPYEGDGNDVLGGNPLPEEVSYFNAHPLSSLGGPTSVNGPFNVSNLEIIRNATLPYVIRATAGLLYWFAKETGMLPTNIQAPVPCVVNISNILEFDPSETLAPVNGFLKVPLTISTPTSLTRNGRTYYFAGWSDGVSTNSRTIIPTADVTISVLYKCLHLSNNSSAYSNNSQRKFVRTTDGNLHMVYESLGHVWYEISSDNGTTWAIANNGKPLDVNGGKLPAIDCGGDNIVVIIWEEYYGGGSVQLKIAKFQQGVMWPYYPLIAFDDGNQGYSQNLNPVIAYDYENRVVIAWENKVNSVYPVGIVWKHGAVGALSDYGIISSTDANCTSPTISAAKNPSDQYNMIYGLAWQYNQSATSSYINFCKLTFNSGGVTVSGVSNISSGDGFPLNYKPSIIAVQNGTARVCWIGANTNTNIYETVFRDPDNYRFWLFSYKVASVSINATDDNSAYYVAWSRNATGNNYVNQYTDSGTLSHISTANSTGQDIQLCNGYNKSSTYFCSFSPNTLPYPFTTSNSLNNFPKINQNGINSDRGIVISKRSAQFFYSFGDLAVDNNNINFIKAPDTVNFNNLDKINNVLVTNPFTINNNSAIVFSECSGVIDSLTALSVLGDTGYVSFKSELIDNSTNNVIGTIRDSRLNAGELHDYNIASYNLNTDGLNGKTVKVKVTISTNIDSINSALTEHYADGNTVGKATVKSITLQKSDPVTEYSLEQNYPNPFNPTTVINYQVPKDGLVTIKIYDVLGNEVRTLVNDNRATGKYSVSFDGSKLASGVYFYQLRVTGGASNFVSTKKMLLLK
jgi:hypothetical protein